MKMYLIFSWLIYFIPQTFKENRFFKIKFELSRKAFSLGLEKIQQTSKGNIRVMKLQPHIQRVSFERKLKIIILSFHLACIYVPIF